MASYPAQCVSSYPQRIGAVRVQVEWRTEEEGGGSEDGTDGVRSRAGDGTAGVGSHA